MHVVSTVAASSFLLLLLPFVTAVLSVLDACRDGDQQGQHTQGTRSDGDVEQRDAELVGAIRFLLVET
jgi:hypothetical protein